LADKFEHHEHAMAALNKIITLLVLEVISQCKVWFPTQTLNPVFECNMFHSVQLWEEIIQTIRPLGLINSLHAVVSPSQEIVQYCLCCRCVQQGFQLKCDVGVKAQPRCFFGGGVEELAGVHASQSLLLFFGGRLGEGEIFCV